jgi:hypothetical protein
MSTNPRTLAEQFLRSHRPATEREAIQFAQQRFPNLPIAVATFVGEWLNLRDRLLDASQGNPDWEPVTVSRYKGVVPPSSTA